MIIISHRVNTINKLLNISEEYGIEIDLRTRNEEIIISHDPFKNGEYFEDWIRYYKHKILILNVKEDGLESKIIEILRKNKIDKFFFLDQSFPAILKSVNKREKHSAIRVSEYESIETAVSLKGKVEWIWVDHFTKFPLDFKAYKFLKDLGFKICIVSPELQNGNLNTAKELKNKLLSDKIEINAVCTKYLELWI